jgi:fumarate hydratase subunit beta
MMTPQRIALPASREELRALRAGDMVLLDGEIVLTAGLPTHHRLLECCDGTRALPRPLDGAALFHLGSYSRETAGGGLEVLYMNPTTSTRFNPLMPRLIRHFGLAMVGGKGGLDQACAAAMREVGCVYLSFLGGGAELHTAAIRAVVSVHWNDLVAHYRLTTLRVEGLGPLTVGIDAAGDSLYDRLSADAEARLPAIMAGLAQARGGA